MKKNQKNLVVHCFFAYHSPPKMLGSFAVHGWGIHAAMPGQDGGVDLSEMLRGRDRAGEPVAKSRKRTGRCGDAGNLEAEDPLSMWLHGGPCIIFC